jgi:acetate CoA/acetoacetate CoA-transferase beta subunit
MAVIAFPDGKATLMETAPGVKVADVLAVTEAELAVPDKEALNWTRRAPRLNR